MNEQMKLLKLSFPLFFESLLFTVIGSVDALMLSNYSDTAVGAVGVANQILFLVLIAGNIIAQGAGILMTQYVGAKRKSEDLQTLTITALIVNTVLGLFFSALLVLFSPELLSIMDLNGEMLRFSSEYFIIISRYLFLHLMTMTFSVYLRSHGETKTTLKVSVLMNIVNVVLNYILIYGHAGFDALGVQGAAYATVISRLVGFVVLGSIVYRMGFYQKTIRFTPASMMNILPRILKLGAPAAGEQISYNLAKFVMMIFITRLGDVAITAYSYSNTLAGFVYIFSVSLGQGTAIMIGWYTGSGHKEKAKILGTHSAKLSFSISMILCTLLVVFRVPFLRILTDNLEILTLAGHVLLFNFIVEAGRSQNLIYVNALRAVGDVNYPFRVSLFSMWGIGVFFSYIFAVSLSFGLPGIWIALGLDEIVRALLFRKRWLMDPPQTAFTTMEKQV